MKKLTVAAIIILCLSFVFSACSVNKKAGDGSAKTTSTTIQKTNRDLSALEKAEGTYTAEKFALTLSASDENVADIIIKTPDEKNPEGEIWWNMTGEYNAETGEIKYSDCVKTTRVNGDVVEQVYENGTGTFYYQNGKIVWADNEERVADGLQFVLSQSTAQ
ncbi:MAG: hypothetical protein IJU45_02670 [Clostridia bacterium]|nr:hypothetical protein [Clostridia bacterium]